MEEALASAEAESFVAVEVAAETLPAPLSRRLLTK